MSRPASLRTAGQYKVHTCSPAIQQAYIKKQAAVINKNNKLYTRQIDPAHMQSGKHNMAKVL